MVNYKIPIPSAPNKHNNLYQSPLKGTVISLQSLSLHNETPCSTICNKTHGLKIILVILDILSGTVVGLFSNQYDEDEGPYRVPSGSSQKPDFDVMTNYVQIPEEETRQKGDFLRSLSVTPSPIIATAGPYYTTRATASPAYFFFMFLI